MDGQPRFRIYEFTRYYIETITGNIEKLEHCTQTISLSDVKSFRNFSFKEFPQEPGKFTHITTYQGDGYVAKIAYEDFRGLFVQYLSDMGDLDNRTMKPE